MFIFHKNVTFQAHDLASNHTTASSIPNSIIFLVVLQPALSPSELSQPGTYTLNSLTDTSAS